LKTSLNSGAVAMEEPASKRSICLSALIQGVD
jgi:hypothetical protein